MRDHSYLTARDVAELLKLNIETVYRLAANDQLPALKIGGQWRFDASEIRKWFRNLSSASTANSQQRVGGQSGR